MQKLFSENQQYWELWKRFHVKTNHLVVLRHYPIIWFVRDTNTCRLEFSWSHLTVALVWANFDRNYGKKTCLKSWTWLCQVHLSHTPIALRFWRYYNLRKLNIWVEFLVLFSNTYKISKRMIKIKSLTVFGIQNQHN